MSHRSASRRKFKILIDGYDAVEVASIDSFPASDPPGWIDSEARPCDEPVSVMAADSVPRASKHRRR
jgi:hypothetical protein